MLCVLIVERMSDVVKVMLSLMSVMRTECDMFVMCGMQCCMLYTYNARRMLHRKQNPQDMETIQNYCHTQARERFRDSEELPTNLALFPFVQTIRTNDSKHNNASS